LGPDLVKVFVHKTTKEVLPCLEAESHREKRSLAGLMSCIFNAAANTEKMSRTGLEPKKS
jgi:hypothetical protein